MFNKINENERTQLDVLKMENTKLQKEIREISIKSELNDWKNIENFSSTVDIGLWLDVTLNEITEYGLTFNVECSNDRFEYIGDGIEIQFYEIENWFEQNNKSVTQSNLNDCIEVLINHNI
jgi:hypothetical protein